MNLTGPSRNAPIKYVNICYNYLTAMVQQLTSFPNKTGFYDNPYFDRK